MMPRIGLKQWLFATRCVAAALAGLALPACLHVHTDPVQVEIKPITLNVNIKYVDDKLDNFFAFQQKYQGNPTSTQATTQAGTEPAPGVIANPETAQ